MVDVWPATLPQYMLKEGYSEGIGDGRIRSQPDAGPAKVRRRSSAMPRSLQGRMIMSAAQLATMQEFVDVTLKNGTQPFLLPDPITRYPSLVRFAGSLPAHGARGIDYEVSLDLEVFYTMKPTTIVESGQLLLGSTVRGSTATYFDSLGVLRTAAANVLRLDHDPVTKAVKGALIEGAATNLLTWSEDFTNAAWFKGGTATVTAGVATAPDGTVTVSRLVGILGFANRVQRLSTVAAAGGSTVTHSIWAAANGNGNNLSYALTSSGGGTYKETVKNIVLTNELKRYDISLTLNADNVGCVPIIYGGTGTSSIDIWGAQLEAGSFPTSYIKTTTAAATRAADVVSVATTAFQFNAAEGTLFVELLRPPLTAGAFPGAAAIETGTNNRFGAYLDGTSTKMGVVGRVNGPYEFGPVLSASLAQGDLIKAAFGFKHNDAAASINGSVPVTDTALTIPTFAQLVVGRYDSYLNGHIKRLVFHPRRLSNSELQALTA